MADNTPIVRVQGLTKYYEAHSDNPPVLRKLSLEVYQREFVALLGKSGSGKTTLLNIIGALDRDYSGTVIVDGRDLKKLGDRSCSRFRNQTIGFVFQMFNLLPHLTCIENVEFPAYFRTSITSKEARSRALEAMERVGIAHKAKSHPNKLSGGEKQRVAIARALFQKPKLLLADEPTGNLDSVSGRQIMDLFLSLKKSEGLTVILVTHDHDFAKLADRIVRIKDGAIANDKS